MIASPARGIGLSQWRCSWECGIALLDLDGWKRASVTRTHSALRLARSIALAPPGRPLLNNTGTDTCTWTPPAAAPPAAPAPAHHRCTTTATIHRLLLFHNLNSGLCKVSAVPDEPTIGGMIHESPMNRTMHERRAIFQSVPSFSAPATVVPVARIDAWFRHTPLVWYFLPCRTHDPTAVETGLETTTRENALRPLWAECFTMPPLVLILHAAGRHPLPVMPDRGTGQ